ncbi:hypothetical protein D3874_12705 [Oleomonas cavernae]|uniref:Uncharacterized protein n=1 Tax=Oleomonas cavernae TaxID=2320859 RepID=A0A418WCR5_9PROT|nr:hypothetical protein [Oleomonas cavernae]RJF87780.1 hypothetical protein D3874_12705 [Oleomonas cavernae]
MTIANGITILVIGVSTVLGGCMAQGPVDLNLGRIPTWLSYLSGDDVKAACEAGGPDRIRFVYNAVWTEQVRAYDLKVTDYGAQMDEHVWGPGVLLAATAQGPQISADKASVGISKARLEALEGAMAADGVDGPAPRGEFLRSDNFYWVVARCRQGRFHFNAFQAPDARFAALTFPRHLFDADLTGIAINPPRPLDLPLLESGYGHDSDQRPFTAQVSANGLDIPRFF